MPILLLTADLLAQAAPAAPAPGSPAADPTPWVAYAVLAFGVAIALMIVEAFMPSGGVLGVLAGLCAIAGIVMFFRFDTTWGLVSMALTLIAAPFAIAGLLWVLPNTLFARMMTHESISERINDHPGASAEHASGVAVGDEGEAVSELRPVGACRLAGQRIDCIAQSGMIDKGTKVRVVHIEGGSVKVRAVEP